MKKIMVLVFGFMLVFLINSVTVNAQGGGSVGNCDDAQPPSPPQQCQTNTNCGAQECMKTFNDEGIKVAQQCIQQIATCTGPQAELCKGPIKEAFKQAMEIVKTTALSSMAKLIQSGAFGQTDCIEMNDCFLQQKGNMDAASFTKMKCTEITEDTFRKLAKDYKGKLNFESNLPTNNPEAIKAIIGEKYKFTYSETLGNFIKNCQICAKEQLNLIANEQSWSNLNAIKGTLAAKNIDISFFNQVGTIIEAIKSNPIVQTVGAVSTIFGLFETGKKIVDLVAGNDEEDEEQTNYRQNNYAQAQNDINNAQNSQAQGTSQWTNCPGHRDGRCSGQAVCVTDSNSGASQCIAALPGQHVTVRFGSIYVIDNLQKNMFTLTGSQNEGVVYQQDGTVNIDKGGTTKISVAGQGVLITDVDNNKLYLGRGTTIYFGNGNEDTATYLTNTFVLDYNSKVAVNAVNGIEQNKFKESTSKGNLKQNTELALTLNKNNLKPYKNALDIGNLQGQYQLLTRGFSNIVLVEKDKIFPLMSRVFAKGDSLIVKNKNVKVPSTYIIRDKGYEYTIKTIDDSTKVLTKNEKVIQDSGPLSTKLSRRQALLIYNA